MWQLRPLRLPNLALGLSTVPVGRIRRASSSFNGSQPSRPPISNGTPLSLASSASPSSAAPPPLSASAETGTKASRASDVPIAATTCSVPSRARASSSALHAPRSVPSFGGSTSATISCCACPTDSSSGQFPKCCASSFAMIGSCLPTSAGCSLTSSRATSPKPRAGASAPPWSHVTRPSASSPHGTPIGTPSCWKVGSTAMTASSSFPWGHRSSDGNLAPQCGCFVPLQGSVEPRLRTQTPQLETLRLSHRERNPPLRPGSTAGVEPINRARPAFTGEDPLGSGPGHCQLEVLHLGEMPDSTRTQACCQC